jgi:hypothetical protein
MSLYCGGECRTPGEEDFIRPADVDYPQILTRLSISLNLVTENLAGGHIAGRARKRTLRDIRYPDWISLLARFRSLLSDNFTLLIVLGNLVKNRGGTAASPM